MPAGHTAAHFSSCFIVCAATFDALTSSAVSFSAAGRGAAREREV